MQINRMEYLNDKLADKAVKNMIGVAIVMDNDKNSFIDSVDKVPPSSKFR